MISEVVNRILDIYMPKDIHPEEWDIKGLEEYVKDIFPVNLSMDQLNVEEVSRENIANTLVQKAEEAYKQKEAGLGSEVMRELERYIMLKTVDQKWMDHLDAMDQLRDGIGLRAYGQRDPVIEYKFEGYEMFQEMIKSIQEDTLRYLFRVKVKAAPER